MKSIWSILSHLILWSTYLHRPLHRTMISIPSIASISSLHAHPNFLLLHASSFQLCAISLSVVLFCCCPPIPYVYRTHQSRIYVITVQSPFPLTPSPVRPLHSPVPYNFFRPSPDSIRHTPSVVPIVRLYIVSCYSTGGLWEGRLNKLRRLRLTTPTSGFRRHGHDR